MDPGRWMLWHTQFWGSASIPELTVIAVALVAITTAAVPNLLSARLELKWSRDNGYNGQLERLGVTLVWHQWARLFQLAVMLFDGLYFAMVPAPAVNQNTYVNWGVILIVELSIAFSAWRERGARLAVKQRERGYQSHVQSGGSE